MTTPNESTGAWEAETRACLGQQLGKYRLMEELARGGMGVVYRALDRELERQVALKVLHGDQAERFRREAELAARLRHDGTIRIHEFGESRLGDGSPVFYLAMELVEGGTLRDRIGTSDLGAKIALFAQVSRAVAHAHAQGVVHRDLKPENVLIRLDGRAVVTDFGLARADDSSPLTESGVMLGTAYYMAPEQLLGQREAIGPHSDVWSLGVILYQLLTGQRPFDALRMAELSLQILEQEPTPPEQASVRHTVPGPLSAICLKALSKPRGQRYADAGELCRDLERFEAGEAVRAGRRARLPVLVCLALVSLLALWGWWRRRPVIGPALVGPDPPATPAPARVAQASGRLARVLRMTGQAQAGAYLAGFDMARALRELREEVAALAREVPEARRTSQHWSALGVGWHFAGSPQRARAALVRAVSQNPRDDWARRYLGQSVLGQAMMWRFNRTGFVPRPEREQALWREAVEVFGRSGGGALDRHLVATLQAVAARNNDTARQRCAEGLVRFGRQPGAEILLTLQSYICRQQAVLEVLGRSLEVRPHDGFSLFLRGIELTRLDRLEEAAADFQAALRLQPGLWYLHSSLGMVYFRLGRLELAWRKVEQAIALEPTWGVPYLNRGALHERRKRWEPALADYARAARVSPDYWHAWYARGRLLRELGRSREAGVDLDRALKMAPDDVETLLERGGLDRALGQPEQAARRFLRATRAAPKDWRAWYRLGRLHADEGRHGQAVAAYDRALPLNRRDPGVWNSRGYSHEQLKQLPAALRDYRQAAALGPGNPAYLNNYANMLEKAGRRKRARAVCDRAVALDRERARSWYIRGNIRGRMGDVAGALADYRQALRLQPTYWKAWVNRGFFLIQSGQRAEGRAHFERGIKLAPPGERPGLRRFLSGLKNR